MPRNVHRSVINALVLCGATPIYVNPDVDNRLGISLGMKLEQVEKAIQENPDAVAVFVNNPTYYGICSNLREIVKLAHDRNMKVLVDEAHGTHFYFGEGFPVNAMDAGADMASVSMHKIRGKPYPELFPSDRKKYASRLCASDHQPYPDYKCFLPASFKP